MPLLQVLLLIILSVFYPGFMTNVYQKGDQLIVIHSHQVHLPVMPRKYRVMPTDIPLEGRGQGAWGGGESLHMPL